MVWQSPRLGKTVQNWSPKGLWTRSTTFQTKLLSTAWIINEKSFWSLENFITSKAIFKGPELFIKLKRANAHYLNFFHCLKQLAASKLKIPRWRATSDKGIREGKTVLSCVNLIQCIFNLLQTMMCSRSVESGFKMQTILHCWISIFWTPVQQLVEVYNLELLKWALKFSKS